MKTKPLSRKTRSLRAIKRYAKKGYSSNEIIRRLKKRKLGMRRKRVLEEIRLIKQKQVKVNQYKYTPKKYKKTLVSLPKVKIIKLYRACVVMNNVPISSRPFHRNYLGFRVCGFHVDKGYLSDMVSRLKQILIRETELFVGYKTGDWWWEVVIGTEFPTVINVPNAQFLNGRWIFRVEREGREIRERTGYL